MSSRWHAELFIIMLMLPVLRSLPAGRAALGAVQASNIDVAAAPAEVGAWRLYNERSASTPRRREPSPAMRKPPRSLMASFGRLESEGRSGPNGAASFCTRARSERWSFAPTRRLRSYTR